MANNERSEGGRKNSKLETRDSKQARNSIGKRKRVRRDREPSLEWGMHVRDGICETEVGMNSLRRWSICLSLLFACGSLSALLARDADKPAQQARALLEQ